MPAAALLIRRCVTGGLPALIAICAGGVWRDSGAFERVLGEAAARRAP